MRKSKPQNTVILIVTVLYVLFTLPIVYGLLILVIAVTTNSVYRENEDRFLRMFAFIGRFINRTQKLTTHEAPFRAEIVRSLASIDQYPKYMDSVIKRKKQLYFMLENRQRTAAISNYNRLKTIENLALNNLVFLEKIKRFAMKRYSIQNHELYKFHASEKDALDLLDHFVRDWSVEPVIVAKREEINAIFLKHIQNKQRILVPGSGLGRLASELSKLNPRAVVDAPELNVAMYLSSEYILHRGENENTETVYPYINQFSHWRNGEDQLQAVPLKFDPIASPSYDYQNFLTIADVKYDAIATLYFIDTAQNVFDYIDKIWELLEDNGVWCNLGPLKWGTAAFAELSVDELVSYLKSNGWEFIEFIDNIANRYNGSENSMLDTKYRTVGWAAKKVGGSKSVRKSKKQK